VGVKKKSLRQRRTRGFAGGWVEEGHNIPGLGGGKGKKECRCELLKEKLVKKREKRKTGKLGVFLGGFLWGGGGPGGRRYHTNMEEYAPGTDRGLGPQGEEEKARAPGGGSPVRTYSSKQGPRGVGGEERIKKKGKKKWRIRMQS